MFHVIVRVIRHVQRVLEQIANRDVIVVRLLLLEKCVHSRMPARRLSNFLLICL